MIDYAVVIVIIRITCLSLLILKVTHKMALYCLLNETLVHLDWTGR